MYLQQKSAYHAFKGTITEMESDISTVPERSKTEKVQYEITEKVQYEITILNIYFNYIYKINSIIALL